METQSILALRIAYADAARTMVVTHRMTKLTGAADWITKAKEADAAHRAAQAALNDALASVTA